MKRIAFAALACFALACAKPAEEETVETGAAAAPDNSAMDTEVRAAVNKFFETMAGADHVGMDSLMHSSTVFVNGDGSISTHDERLEHHRAGRIKVTKANNEILDVQSFGDDFALVQVRSTSEGESHGIKWVPAVVVLGLARTPGAPWEVVYHQAVRQEAARTP